MAETDLDRGYTKPEDATPDPNPPFDNLPEHDENPDWIERKNTWERL